MLKPTVLLTLASLTLSLSPAFAVTLQKTWVQEPRVKIPVEIYLPKGTGIFPAVVLIHSSGGNNEKQVHYYVQEFSKHNIAIISFDSFTPRHVKNTIYDQAFSVPLPVMTHDALMILQTLAQNPHIDIRRVAVMGFSKGAGAAMQTAFKIRNKGFKYHFQVAIPLYPPMCNQMVQTKVYR